MTLDSSGKLAALETQFNAVIGAGRNFQEHNYQIDAIDVTTGWPSN